MRGLKVVIVDEAKCTFGGNEHRIKSGRISVCYQGNISSILPKRDDSQAPTSDRDRISPFEVWQAIHRTLGLLNEACNFPAQQRYEQLSGVDQADFFFKHLKHHQYPSLCFLEERHSIGDALHSADSHPFKWMDDFAPVFRMR